MTTDIGRATPTAGGSADRAANPRGQETGSGASRGATRRGLGSRAFNVCTKRFTGVVAGSEAKALDQIRKRSAEVLN